MGSCLVLLTLSWRGLPIMGSCLVLLTLSWRRRRRDPPRTAPEEGCMHIIPHGRGQPRDGDEHAKALPIDETHRAVDAQLRDGEQAAATNGNQ